MCLSSPVDDGADIPREMVSWIYDRIQQRELRSNEDHVTYVSRVEQSMLGMKTVSIRVSVCVCVCVCFFMFFFSPALSTNTHVCFNIFAGIGEKHSYSFLFSLFLS